MTDILERLNDIWANDDHERGCQGREYSCSCGFDNRTAKTAEDAATEITRLRQLLSEAEKREKEARAKAHEEAAAYHEYRADNHAAAHRHVVSDFHELMEKTHRDAAADIRALQSEER